MHLSLSYSMCTTVLTYMSRRYRNRYQADLHIHELFCSTKTSRVHRTYASLFPVHNAYQATKLVRKKDAGEGGFEGGGPARGGGLVTGQQPKRVRRPGGGDKWRHGVRKGGGAGGGHSEDTRGRWHEEEKVMMTPPKVRMSEVLSSFFL